MSLLILVVGILVSVVFDRQERRHHMELWWEYRRLNLPMPVPPPKLTVLQAWLNIVLGLVLTAFGCISAAAVLYTPMTPSWDLVSTSALFLGGGIVLVVLGVAALMERRRYHSRKE